MIYIHTKKRNLKYTKAIQQQLVYIFKYDPF